MCVCVCVCVCVCECVCEREKLKMAMLTHPIQQYSFARLSMLGLKEVRELHWKDDCFLESLLGLIKTCNIIPVDIGFLRDNGTYRGGFTSTQYITVSR